MMGIFSKFKTTSKQDDVVEAILRGGRIIDVRSTGEYAQGHVENSLNIPLNTIQGKIKDIKKMNVPIVVCCASGMRSAQANSILKNAGIESYNGGSWYNLQ